MWRGVALSAASFLSSSLMLLPRLLKTFVHFVLEKKVLALKLGSRYITKEPFSIVSSKDMWHRADGHDCISCDIVLREGTFFGKMVNIMLLNEAIHFFSATSFMGLGSYESPKLKHDGTGLLSMAIADREERGSLFNITFKADHHLDWKNIVFGKLVDGHEVLKKIENAGDDEGKPAVTVKIVNSGEAHDDSSTDTDTDTSESDTDSDSYDSSLSDTSSSSDDRRKKRKRSKRDRHRRGKRKDRRHEKRRKRRDKKSKRKSKRNSISDSDTKSKSGSSSEDDAAVGGQLKKNSEANHSPLVDERENTQFNHKKGDAANVSEREEGEFPRENGNHRKSNGIEVGTESDRSADRDPDVVDVPSKSRYPSYRRSPRRYRSPPRGRTPPRYRGRRSRSRSASVSRSPIRYRGRRYSRSRSPIRSRSPVERHRGSPRAERRRSPSRSRSRSQSGSHSSRDSQSPKRADKGNSRSSSGTPPRKTGLVSYGDGSPDSGRD
ncbi:UNVERIFIED_CONTAM: Peptidyl-prolyl cis-trans isomerase CYP95 [Sesamum radiatum]|uniref:Peptidyl-prolyl cis-trans isomerase CYP95 n=1 Tax=Sesamum radiatum TaxID=300843 RepID=A0AAW2JT67_SESRA